MRTCEVEGCDRKHDARGFCKAHYHRRARYGTPTGSSEWLPAFSAVRAALAVQDYPSVIRALLVDTLPAETGCREWQRRMHKGYPEVVLAKRYYSVHRLMAGAKLGRRLRPDEPVHHICANTRCIEPSHLQLVTARENMAEMLERRAYKQRIAALEAALAAIDPAHPLLPAA